VLQTGKQIRPITVKMKGFMKYRNSRIVENIHNNCHSRPKPIARPTLEVTQETRAAAERIRRFISEQQALSQVSLRAATQVLEQSQLFKNAGYDDAITRHLLEVDALTKSAAEQFRRAISEQQQLMNEAAINAAKLMSSSIRLPKIPAIDFEELNKAMMLG
jgi:hypothetical protein